MVGQWNPWLMVSRIWKFVWRWLLICNTGLRQRKCGLAGFFFWFERQRQISFLFFFSPLLCGIPNKHTKWNLVTVTTAMKASNKTWSQWMIGGDEGLTDWVRGSILIRFFRIEELWYHVAISCCLSYFLFRELYDPFNREKDGLNLNR